MLNYANAGDHGPAGSAWAMRSCPCCHELLISTQHVTYCDVCWLYTHSSELHVPFGDTFPEMALVCHNCKAGDD